MISNQKYDFRPKLHDTEFNYHFITSILKSPIFLKIYIGPQGWFVKSGTGNAFTCTCQQKRMTDVTLQKFIGAQRKQESTSCKCSSSSKSCYRKNSRLQSLILVVWLNNISPSLLLRLWLRHRVFLGEKIESTAGVILRWSSSIRDLKQRRFWATHVNRKWGLLLFICLDANKLVLLSFFKLPITSTSQRCHAVLKLWWTTWRKSCKTSSLKIRIQEFHGLVHLTLLLGAINKNHLRPFFLLRRRTCSGCCQALPAPLFLCLHFLDDETGTNFWIHSSTVLSSGRYFCWRQQPWALQFLRLRFQGTW